MEKLARQCEALEIPAKQLIDDVKTRWNSTFLMLERALELREPLDNFAACDRDLREYQLTDEEWSLLETVSGLLKVFKDATDCLCASSYPTLSTAIPIYNYMMDQVEDFRDTHSECKAIVEATSAAIEKFKEYYSKGSDAAVYPVATILDPRLKMEYYREHKWEPEWINLAKETLERVFRTYGTSTIHSAPASHHEEPRKAIMAHVFKRQRMTEMDELCSYLASPRADMEVDVLSWWKANASVYPRLSEIARDYLAIPATGAPVERMFSIGTDVVTQKRASLNPDTIRACLCLNTWLEE
jgi:hypothetical protein